MIFSCEDIPEPVRIIMKVSSRMFLFNMYTRELDQL